MLSAAAPAASGTAAPTSAGREAPPAQAAGVRIGAPRATTAPGGQLRPGACACAARPRPFCTSPRRQTVRASAAPEAAPGAAAAACALERRGDASAAASGLGPLGADEYASAPAIDLLNRDDAWGLRCGLIDTCAWLPFVDRLPRDQYASNRWRRMSWLAARAERGLGADADLDGTRTDVGAARAHPGSEGAGAAPLEFVDLGPCPLSQSSYYNNVRSMGGVARLYEPLEPALVSSPSFQFLMRSFAHTFGLGPGEPIGVVFTGSHSCSEDGEAGIDPLQGQSTHQDGYEALAMVCVKREGVTGAVSSLYRSLHSPAPFASAVLAPGDVLAVKDAELYHGVSGMAPSRPGGPLSRYILVLLARTRDPLQAAALRQAFPRAVLHVAPQQLAGDGFSA